MYGRKNTYIGERAQHDHCMGTRRPLRIFGEIGELLHETDVINHTLWCFDALCKRTIIIWQNKPQKGLANGKVKIHFRYNVWTTSTRDCALYVRDGVDNRVSS